MMAPNNSNNMNAFEAARNKWASLLAVVPGQSQLPSTTVLAPSVQTSTTSTAVDASSATLPSVQVPSVQQVPTVTAVHASSATPPPVMEGQSLPAVGASSAGVPPAPTSMSAVGSINGVFERIANALERIGDFLQQQVSPAAAPAAPAPQQMSAPVASQDPPVFSSPQQSDVNATIPVPPAWQQPLQNPNSFNTNDAHEVSDVDPEKKCGVCHGECEENDIFAMLDCGHYPYCHQCIQILEDAKQDMHFKCPACQSCGATKKIVAATCNFPARQVCGHKCFY